MMKKILIVIGTIAALGLAAAGGFYSGMRYQSNQAEQVRSAFASARGQADSGQLPGDSSGFQANGVGPGGMANGQAPAGQMPGAMGGPGTNGVVKTVEGDVMTISTAQDVTTVNLSDSIPVQQTVSGTIADLQPGMRVRIIGQADDNGVITASQVVILDESQAGQPVFGQDFGGNGYPAPADSATPTVEEP